METETQDAQEVLETPETPTEPVEESTTEETAEQKLERIEREKADLESKNKQLFERIKKAEEKKPEAPAPQLSTTDILTLAKANIHEDDLARVTKWMTDNGQSVKQALEDDDLKAILDNRASLRRTAQATQTGAPRGAAKVNGEDILRKAETTGEVPETTEGMQALFRARQARRIPNRK